MCFASFHLCTIKEMFWNSYGWTVKKSACNSPFSTGTVRSSDPRSLHSDFFFFQKILLFPQIKIICKSFQLGEAKGRT